MDQERLRLAREKLGLGRKFEAPAPATVVEKTQVEPEAIKQPEPKPQENKKWTGARRPLEGLDLLSQKLLREVRGASPVVQPEPAPTTPVSQHPVTTPQPLQPKSVQVVSQGKASPIPGIALSLAGLGLVGAGVAYGGRR